MYYLRYAAGGRRVWEDVGSDPQLALLAKERKERVAAARAAGIAMVEDGCKAKIRLAEAIATYGEDTRLTKAPKTAEAYR